MSDVDWTDWTVYSNAAYPLSALPLWGEPWLFVPMALVGVALGAASAWYHATYTRTAQRADVTMVITYLAAVLAVYLSVWVGPYSFALVPAVHTFYLLRTWSIDSHVHAPAWIVAALAVLTWLAGTWAIPSWVLAIAAGVVTYFEEDSDSLFHGHWHVLGSGAVGWSFAALALILPIL